VLPGEYQYVTVPRAYSQKPVSVKEAVTDPPTAIVEDDRARPTVGDQRHKAITVVIAGVAVVMVDVEVSVAVVVVVVQPAIGTLQEDAEAVVEEAVSEAVVEDG